MKTERWQQVEQLYHAALERGAEERAAFLAEACAGDDELRREVESLLAYEAEAANFIESPALEVAAQMLATEQGAAVAAGQMINHYRVISPLGAGGMGEVYLAEDVRLGRPVALKLLPAQFTAEAERVRRFEQEARAASALNHPNIITIHEIGQADSAHFIATEFIDGETLRRRMHTTRMALGEVLDIAAQVASALAAAVAVLTVAAVAYFFYSAKSGEAIDSVAVLPFVNASGDPEAEYLSDGISDDIITSLSRLPNLRVISLNAVLRYKGQQTDPAAVGRALHVRAVLLGRLVRRGESLAVSTELVDVRDNSRLWGEQYNRKLSDILDLQGEIAREISARLRLRLTGEEQKQLAKHYTENPEAYELYLKGRYFFDKRTVGGIRQSKEYFREAINKDPNYALAYAGLANAYTPSDFLLLPAETMAEAKAAAKRALELDGTLAEGHTAQARILLFYDLDWQGAERELKRAIELNPKYAEAHHMYAHYLTYVDQSEQALAESRRALELEPLDVLLNVHLGWQYLYARQYDQAIEQTRKAIEMEPNFFRAHLFLGRAYEQKGMYKEALTAYRRAMALEVDSAETVVMLGHLHAVAGDRTEALRILDDLRARYKRKAVSAYDLAIIHAGLGEREQALEWLRQAYEERFGGLLLLKADPNF